MLEQGNNVRSPSPDKVTGREEEEKIRRKLGLGGNEEWREGVLTFGFISC